MRNPKVEFIPTQRIAYMRRIGLYGPENRKIMENLKQWAKGKGLFNEAAVIYAIAQDNPMVTAPENCRYDVCITISDSFDINCDVNEGVFEKGWYAVFIVTHTAEAIQQAWQYIFQKAIEAGCQIDENKVVVERYRQELVNNHLCELCVPIIK
jgi:DNA gyrase inhibitor GyrI